MTKALTKKMYKLHQFIGVISGLILLIIGLSGSILVFHEEIDSFYYDRFPTPKSYTSTPNIDAAFKNIHSKFPNLELRLVNPRPVVNQNLVFSVRGKEKMTVLCDPIKGSIVGELKTQNTFTNWLLELHYMLRGGQTGKIIVFITGILFLTSIITGFIIYRKSILNVLRFKTRINSSDTKTISSSLHRTIGVWSLLMNFIMAITGVLISFGIVSNGWKNGKNKNSVVCNVNCSINESLKNIQSNYPDFQPNYIRFPKKDGAPILVLGKFKNDFFLYHPNSDRFEVDANSGSIQKVVQIEELSLMDKVDSFADTIHFAEFGGWPIKFILCLTGLSIPLLSITGFVLWYSKRKKRDFRLQIEVKKN